MEDSAVTQVTSVYDTQRFTRSIVRVIAELLLLPVGAAGFVVMAVLLATGALIPDVADPFGSTMARYIGPFLLGLFGLMMASGIPAVVRRGLRRSVLEVGPAGIWTPEMGQLSWTEIAEIRLETVPDMGGSAPTGREVPFRRLGIVPRDAERASHERRRPGSILVGAYVTGLRAIGGPRTYPHPDELAPFGVFSYEIGDAFDRAVAAVRRYREVTEPTPA